MKRITKNKDMKKTERRGYWRSRNGMISYGVGSETETYIGLENPSEEKKD